MLNDRIKKSFVSVILPVYNGSAYLEESVKSILGQTYKNFELIIINDGSTDRSAEVVEQFHDKRLKYIFQKNKGLAATLNYGIHIASGEFIARQDQDDVAIPDRLTKQVHFLEREKKTAIVGSWALILRDRKQSGFVQKHPLSDSGIKFQLLFDNPFVHSSVMMRRDAFLAAGGYSEDSERQPPEDYEAWSRLGRKYGCANIAEILVQYREVPGSMSHAPDRKFIENVAKVSAENISHFLQIPVETVFSFSYLYHGAYWKLETLPPEQTFLKILQNIIEKHRTISQKQESEAEKLYSTATERIKRNYSSLYRKKFFRRIINNIFPYVKNRH